MMARWRYSDDARPRRAGVADEAGLEAAEAAGGAEGGTPRGRRAVGGERGARGAGQRRRVVRYRGG